MKLTALILTALIMTGCTLNEAINKVPTAEFKTFEYHRAGNMTSVDIEAKNSKVEGGTLVIEELDIKADYGPFSNFNIFIEGYKRIIGE